MHFHSDKIEIDEITKDADYAGLRVRLSATVGGDHQRFGTNVSIRIS